MDHMTTAQAAATTQTPTTSRPFGLRFARRPRRPVELDLDRVRYDESRQIALAPDGSDWVPLADHSMSVTLQTSGNSPREDEIYDKSFR